MHHNPKNSDKIVLIFVAVGIGILLVFTSLIMVNNKTFADKTYYRTVVKHAKGLSAKPAVLFMGLEIGRVDSFHLNHANNQIEVEFWVFSEYRSKLVRHAVLIGHQKTLLGDISPFELVLPELDKVLKYQPLEQGELIPHINSELGQAYVKNGLVLVEGDSVDSIIASVNTLLLNLQQENNPDAGSLFRILDRIAKITDHLLNVSESLRKSSILPEAEQMLAETEQFVSQFPDTLNRVNRLLDSVDKTVNQANTTIASYSQPQQLVAGITDNQIPPMLNSMTESLQLLQIMLKDVHAQREQLAITVHSVQQVLERLDKTLQGVNNNPLLKQGIELKTKPQGIEMND